MTLKALFLNCTLKKSPETSNTQAPIDKLTAERLDGSYRDLDPETGQYPFYGRQRTR